MIWPRSEGVSNARRLAGASGARVRRGPSRGDRRARAPASAVRASGSHDTPREYARIALRPLAGAVYCSRALRRRDAAGGLSEGDPPALRAGRCPWSVARRSPRSGPQSTLPIAAPPTRNPIDHMDAKQVWRAALGELQVSLSPANFETWLRDTHLVEVDDHRFRIAVPNGFAKDWLETRYRSLISQTLARVVGYSVQVEFIVTPAAEAAGAGRPTDRRASPSASSPPGSAPPRARRPARRTSTRATRSRTSSSGPPTGWPTPRRCRSRSARATRTTRCSCTAASAWARPT